MEDILEEIVGDILDEYDEDDSTFRTQKDNSVIIDALAYLEDVAEELGIDFGKVEFETLNGYLTNLLGHIPTEDDLDKEIVVNGYRFRILSLGNKTIGKVRAEKNTLRHELLHAYLAESGLAANALSSYTAWAENEEMVDWFAIQSPKIFKTFKEVGCL